MSSDSIVVLTVRDGRLDDAAALAELMCELGYSTSELEMRRRLEAILADAHFRTFVAVIDNAVCGMIGTVGSPSHEHNDLSGRIVALVVSQSLRRKGIARRLTEKAEEDFSRRGIRRVTLTTRLTRKDAHKFYAELGYEPTGYRYAKDLARAS
jgi:ribosomal protein S18 acetylase RimI-like enzyme